MIFIDFKAFVQERMKALKNIYLKHNLVNIKKPNYNEKYQINRYYVIVGIVSFINNNIVYDNQNKCWSV